MAASSSGGQYSWETRFGDRMFRPPTGGESDDDDDDSEGDDRDVTPDEAGALLVDFLLEALYVGKMNARQVTTICHWAKLAGCQGPVGKYSLTPNSPSGHPMRKIDKATGISLKDLKAGAYKIKVPQHAKRDISRSIHNMMCQLPHEELHKELQDNPSAAMGHPEPEWTESFRSHPVVLANPGKTVIPFAFYLDGIRYTKRDSVMGMFVYNLFTNKRHLCVILRRSDYCRCGCRGWCTLYPIFECLAWSFKTLAEGKWPQQRHDGPWTSDDTRRESNAGSDLGFVACLLQIKGDWSEYAHTFGLADWSNEWFCCFFCKATRANRYQLDALTPTHSPWPALAMNDYELACSACELWRSLDERLYAEIKASLDFDRRRNKTAGGLVLTKDIPEIMLKKGPSRTASWVARCILVFQHHKLPSRRFVLEKKLGDQGAKATSFV